MKIPFKMAIPPKAIIVRIAIVAALHLVGLVGMMALAGLKEAPAEVKYEEASLLVETMKAAPENIQVTISGYGEVRALDVVSIAPEVAGVITRIHPRLEPGEIIAKGDVLFRIDTRDYGAAHKQARAAVDQCKNMISQLKTRFEMDKGRLENLERNKNLARTQLERMSELCEIYGIVAQSQVEATEQIFNSASDLTEQMEQTIELYPIQIRDAEVALASAEAQLEIAEANLNRCVVRGPFNARVKEVSIEAGQYVAPGFNILTLANDSTLEIHVPLDSRDAQKWLCFDDDRSRKDIAWFNSLKDVSCRIRWTEEPDGHSWEGKLHRVVKFDQQTRTLMVAVRTESENAPSEGSQRLPLVEGMFCSIEIPGSVLHDVYRLPRWVVSFDNTVYVMQNGRLKTIPVEVARKEGDYVYVSSGLEEGAHVVTTRLVDPPENCLLEIAKTDLAMKQG